MNITQIDTNIQALFEDFSSENFIYNFLLAFGTPNATIKKMQLGTLNLSKKQGELIWKKKLYFKEIANEDLHHFIDEAKNNDALSKHEPRFIIVTDYTTLLALDKKTGDSLDIAINELPKHFSFFLPLIGMEKAQHQAENPADVKAAERMAKLYDEIKKDNPINTTQEVHTLNVFLTRLLFCFFAEDTGIFDTNLFTRSIAGYTQADGSDLNTFLDKLFEVMNTEPSSRAELPTYLSAFPYVNGGLFQNKYAAPTFNRRSRQMLIESGELDWAAINPDIFGSMIQAVITPEHRGAMGMHYTSVPNIMKVIEPLFLNDLYEEFEKAKGNLKKLNDLLKRIWNIKIFDPACGSGNFLIIAYKELRKLEMLVFQEIDNTNKTYSNQFSGILLSNFYGIELDDFAHEVAILSLWLAEHQMNQAFFKAFGRAKPALPLQQTGNIVQGNACRLDWEVVCPKTEGDEIYILGNPPYLGSSMQSLEQKSDLAFVCKGFDNYKNLDYIACWFVKGANYIFGVNSQYSFVSTNSICQGEQVALLWPYIFERNLEIGFAYNSFLWVNNAKANAAVFVVIVGVRNNSNKLKLLFNDGLCRNATNINPYLSIGDNITFERRSKSISYFPQMIRGSTFTDNGNLLFSPEEKKKIVENYSNSSAFFKKAIGSIELIRDVERWALHLFEEDLELAYSIPIIRERLSKVTEFRLSSSAESTVEFAHRPHIYKQYQHKDSAAIIIPRVSSIRREYIPIGYVNKDCIILDSAQAIYNAEQFHFSVINSKMHMLWVRITAGRLKSDFRYSSAVCYNHFPFPPISDSQKQELESHALSILEEREMHSEKTLAQLYDPDKMPEGLREAHRQNDLAVERCYRSKPFESDEERLEYLFKLYEQMIAAEKEKNTLFEDAKKSKKK